MSTRAVAPTVAAPAAVLTPVQRPMLQRSCDCGQHTGGGECDDCKKKKKMPLQRYASGSGALPVSSPVAPPIVHEVLNSPGQSLDPETQAFMAPRFRQDFSRVRVHTDERAAESARAVSAHAYTVGGHVVFGAGRFEPTTNQGRQLLAHELSHVVQQRSLGSEVVQHSLEIGATADPLEAEADEIAHRVTERREPDEAARFLSEARPRLQRAAAGPSAPEAAVPSRQAATLLVEDDAKDLHAGQMRKGEFLDKLQAKVCAAADEELAAVGRTAKGCPYIERWIGHLRSKGSQFVERGIRKYAPASAGVATAEGYIPFVTARVRRGVARWAKTGEITEVPDELKGQLLVANAADAMDRLFSGVGGVIGVVGSAAVAGFRAVGGLLAKERDGGVRDADDPRAIQAELGAGHPLEGGTRSRMETALGGDFSQVRIHTDSAAASLSTRVNARAFTIGSNVAFGAGEYQPGTLIGDALLAHELAHVVQQGGESAGGVLQAKEEGATHALEEDADVSAANVVASMWTGVKAGIVKLTSNAIPQMRSGLRLQRCGGAKPAVKATAVPGAPCTAEQRQSMEQINLCCTTDMLNKELHPLLEQAVPVVQAALGSLSSPDDVKGALWDNFRIQPNDNRLTQVRYILRNTLDTMQGSRVSFVCRSAAEDPMCKGIRAATEPTCTSSGTVYMHFCGDYSGAADKGQPFLTGDWLKTMIHEHVHAGCPGSGQVFPAGQEFYKGRDAYPQDPDRNIKNADTYAWFAMDARPKAVATATALPDMSVATPWQLAQIPASTFAPAQGGDAKTAQQFSNYARASQLIRDLFAKYGVTYDAERENRVLGRAVTPDELAILNQNLSEVLGVANVKQVVSGPGGRGLPTSPGATGPTLEGRARIFKDPAEYSIKRFQLQWLVAHALGVPEAEADKNVKSMWTELGVTAATDAVVTEQERRAVALVAFRATMSLSPAFYFPPDDIFYFAPGTNLKEPRSQATVRHETGHLLAGGRTQPAFVKRFGSPQYIRYWSPFEEGMAEWIALEGTPGGPKPSVTKGPTETESAYGPNVDLMKTIAEDKQVGGRDKLIEAFLTGNIPDRVFDLLKEKVK